MNSLHFRATVKLIAWVVIVFVWSLAVCAASNSGIASKSALGVSAEKLRTNHESINIRQTIMYVVGSSTADENSTGVTSKSKSIDEDKTARVPEPAAIIALMAGMVGTIPRIRRIIM